MEKPPHADYDAIITSGGLVGQPELQEPGPPEISEVERLMSKFEVHETQEGTFVRRYKEIAEKSKNPFVNFLLRLMISDEEKHHAVLHAMVSTLKGDLTWTTQKDAIRGLYDLGDEKGELLKLTEDFIRLEKEGINEYKKLIKESKGYYRNLFVLLFQGMIHDSETHAEILEFLRQRLIEA